MSFLGTMYYTREQLEKSQSRKDGITRERENEFRRKTCLFIEFVGKKLRIPKSTWCVAQTFLQRFYARHSFKAHDRLIIAATCVFLAGKAEETRVSLQDIIMRYFQATKEPRPSKEKIDDLKERILVSERVLLHTIAFQLSVRLPFPHIYRLAVSVLGKGAEKQRKLVVKSAWTFVTDSMKTSLCLQFHEANIAAAATYMALSYIGTAESKSDSKWWKNAAPGVSLDVDGLQSICLQILETYSGSKPKPKPSTASSSDPAVDEVDHVAIRKHVLSLGAPTFSDKDDKKIKVITEVKVEREGKRPTPVDISLAPNGEDGSAERDTKRFKGDE